MKNKLFVSSLLILVLTFISSAVFASDFTTERPITDAKKDWTIRFNLDIDQSTLITDNIYITDASGTKISTTITDKQSRSVKVTPTEAYKANQAYKLHVTTNVYASTNRPLTKAIQLPFILKVAQTYITKTETFYSSIVTNVRITGQSDVFKITVATANGQEVEMKYGSGNVYDQGVSGVNKGDSLTIRAYDADDRLLETKQIQVQ